MKSHRSRALWRLAFGLLLTLTTAGLLLLIARAGFQVPVPGAIMLVTVCVSAYVGGAMPGYLSAAICVTASLPVLVETTNFLTFVHDPQMRIMGMIGFAAALGST